MNTAPLIRIQLIERSLRCFVLGLLSLLPFIGLPIAAVVLALKWRIDRRSGGAWNPAERYLHWGGVFASCGSWLSVGVAVLLGMIVAASRVPHFYDYFF